MTVLQIQDKSDIFLRKNCEKQAKHRINLEFIS